MSTTKNVFHIKCYTKTQLAAELGFKSTRELNSEMKKAGQLDKLKKESWYYFPKQVEAILYALGRINRPINVA